MTKLMIPNGTEGMKLGTAMLAYANAGWYVLPVKQADPKGAGSVLGKGWPDKTRRDPDEIKAMVKAYAWKGIGGTALHVGRSGALAFDVDDPRHVPAPLRRVLLDLRPPTQTTRQSFEEQGGIVRGHYVFALPEGVVLGNSPGALATDPKWGDVRGTNGIIVTAPTPHPKPEGVYRWIRTGVLPELPAEIGKLLLTSHQAKRSFDPVAASFVDVERRVDGVLTFLAEAPEGRRNASLFWAACRFGELIAHGHLGEDDARDMITIVGEGIGLEPREVSATVDSGIRTGAWAVS